MVASRANLTIAERFEQFHSRNPVVYRLFKDYAWVVKRAGRSRFSADAIVQRIRWFMAFEGDGREEFKINDHYTALYARKLMTEEPDAFGGFFELRKTRTERMLAAAQRDGRLC